MMSGSIDRYCAMQSSDLFITPVHHLRKLVRNVGTDASQLKGLFVVESTRRKKSSLWFLVSTKAPRKTELWGGAGYCRKWICMG